MSTSARFEGVILLLVRRFKPWWLRLKSKVATTLSKAKTILLFCYNPACASKISNLSYMLTKSCWPFLILILPREKEVVGGYAPADPFFNRYTFRVQQTNSHEDLISIQHNPLAKTTRSCRRFMTMRRSHFAVPEIPTSAIKNSLQEQTLEKSHESGPRFRDSASVCF